MTEQDSYLVSETTLMVVVNATTEDKELLSFLRKDLAISEKRGKTFVELILKENLKLKRSTKELQKCQCFIPALKKYAESVNLAGTLISENFEVNRKTHTKNVFKDAYFQDNDNTWKSLDQWRDKVSPLFSDSQNIRDVANQLSKKADKPGDFNKILEHLNVSKRIAEVTVKLQEEGDNEKDFEVQKLLNTFVDVGKLNSILKAWEENKSNSSESFWHKLLAENSFVLSQIYSTPVTILHSKAYVGGKGIENTGGNFTDFIMVNKLTKNTSLIEIKTPVTRLLGSEYRNGIYSPSTDLSGAVNQVAVNRDSLLKNYDRLANQTKSHFEVFNPLCIVILGNAINELSDNDKKKSFEVYRSELRNVQIVTYDEVFEKVKTLIELLQVKD